MLYLSKIYLKNVRCFDEVTIPLSNGKEPRGGWTVFVGDNATGKSALLRAIAIGLCDEASAAGLLKESDEGYIRRDQLEARIVISLFDPKDTANKYEITTTIKRTKKPNDIFADKVRQTTIPEAEEFPWDEIFVSGYGAGRGVMGSGDISGYSSLDAVYNMFNYSEGLQNPELVVRRFSNGDPDREGEILDIFKSFAGIERIQLTNQGIKLDGRWGKNMPLRDLADGYKSSFAWLLDFIGWALAFDSKIKAIKDIEGILILDEIEQHLHARWQRTVVDDLRKLFPRVQFIATTHSPLVASSIGDQDSDPSRDFLYVLKQRETLGIDVDLHPFMMGWRADQVLTSPAFCLDETRSQYIESRLNRYRELLSKSTRSVPEGDELDSLREFVNEEVPEAAQFEEERNLRTELRALVSELKALQETGNGEND